MSKEDCIEVTGTVLEKFPSGLFSVQLEHERVVLAHLAGRLRRNRIRVLAGDPKTAASVRRGRGRNPRRPGRACPRPRSARPNRHRSRRDVPSASRSCRPGKPTGSRPFRNSAQARRNPASIRRRNGLKPSRPSISRQVAKCTPGGRSPWFDNSGIIVSIPHNHCTERARERPLPCRAVRAGGRELLR